MKESGEITTAYQHGRFAVLLFHLCVLLLMEPILLQSAFNVIFAQDRTGIVRSKSVTIDTLKFYSSILPLAKVTADYARPRFETMHLVVGLGAMSNDMASLKSLDIDESNIHGKFSIYASIPLANYKSPGYVLFGWDLGRTGEFKTLVLFDTGIHLLLGGGVGSSWYNYDGEYYRIRASQSYALMAFGLNLDPQRVDLLFTLPIVTDLTTALDNKDYTIKLAGPQLSLLVSIR